MGDNKESSPKLFSLFTRQFACVERIHYLDKALDSLLEEREMTRCSNFLVKSEIESDDQVNEIGFKLEDLYSDLESLAKEQYETCTIPQDNCEFCRNYEMASDEEEEAITQRAVGY